MADVRTLLLLFLIGATVGSFFDGFHTWSGTTAYTEVWFLEMAWWTPPMFGFAGAAIGNLTLEVDRRVGRLEAASSPGTALGAVLLLGVFYFCSGFLPVPNNAVLGILALGAAIAFFLFDRRPVTLAVAAFVGASGALAEILMIHQGMFHYTRPQWAGIPAWTFMLYALASITIGTLARALHRASSAP